MSDHSQVREARRASIELDVHDTIRLGIQRKRDDAIRSAYADGATIAELVRAVNLTRTMLYKIINKEEA